MSSLARQFMLIGPYVDANDLRSNRELTHPMGLQIALLAASNLKPNPIIESGQWTGIHVRSEQRRFRDEIRRWKSIAETKTIFKKDEKTE